ncbi:hypothetical protein OTUT144_0477, partial [Orientia tsutsugamushi str. UT144]
MLEEQYKNSIAIKHCNRWYNKEDYGKKLTENLLLLLTRIRKGQYQA